MMAGLRIAYSPHLDVYPVDPRVATVVGRPAHAFEEAGIDVLGDHRDDLPPEYLRWIEETARLTADDITRDQQMRRAVFDAIQGVFATHDLLVSPTLAALPVDNAGDGNTVGPTEVAGVDVDPLIGWCMTYFTNFTGYPAASIPVGFADELPVGMQVIGPRFGDADVLAASAAFEQRRPWHDSYARCRGRPLNAART